MNDPMHFYFDLSSPYGYFAANKIDELAGRFDRQVIWHPILLGAIFKVSGSSPLASQPLKWEYTQNDLDRMARFMELPWKLPQAFPISTHVAARAFYWINQTDPVRAKTFALACYDHYFGHGLDISSPETVAEIGKKIGLNGDDLRQAVQDQTFKDKLRDETSAAIEAGVCGSPFYIIDGETFWGADRLWMVRRWLKSGGW